MTRRSKNNIILYRLYDHVQTDESSYKLVIQLSHSEGNLKVFQIVGVQLVSFNSTFIKLLLGWNRVVSVLVRFKCNLYMSKLYFDMQYRLRKKKQIMKTIWHCILMGKSIVKYKIIDIAWVSDRVVSWPLPAKKYNINNTLYVTMTK